MARPPAPCGSFTAYKRHKRNEEPVDEACAQAARDQKNDRKVKGDGERAAAVRAHLAAVPEVDASVRAIDELDEAYETLEWIKAQMASGVTQGAAALAKQRMELVGLIRQLESASKPEVSALDEIARKRAERLAASSN